MKDKYENTEVTKNGALQVQVCSDLPIEEVLDWVRRTNPAGTTSNWQITYKPEYAPVTCASYPERKHYIFEC